MNIENQDNQVLVSFEAMDLAFPPLQADKPSTSLPTPPKEVVKKQPKPKLEENLLESRDADNHLKAEFARAPFCVSYLLGNSHLAKHRGLSKELAKLLHPNALVENFAVGGGIVNNYFEAELNRVKNREKEYPSLNDTFVVIMTGDNDLRKGADPVLLARNLMGRIENSAKPIDNLVFIVCGAMSSPSLAASAVTQFNDELETTCEILNSQGRLRAYFLDLDKISQMRPPSFGNLPHITLFAGDKVHLSPSGERIVATIIASFLNPLIHKELNCKAFLIKEDVLKAWLDPRFVDYTRMKGVFKRTYRDILVKKQFVNPSRIIGLARDLKHTVGLNGEPNKDFNPSFNYSIVFDQLMKHHDRDNSQAAEFRRKE
jgi:lysophospholipase L1-like esterase